jgi:Zn-finger nucleic acid-binding protein
MVKFQVICPECRAAVVTSHPEALVWERCPGCGRHTWDRYDALMADVIPEAPGVRARSVQINN